jgi:hypothetical protein
MIKFIKNIFSSPKNFKIQSFTFYIPSPPARSSGYREKHFDKLFYEFINRGYEIISLKTESSSGTNQSGMWIICLVRALNEEASKLNLDDVSEQFTHDSLEELYYIDNDKNEKI